jgi:hypothetical protein
MLAQPLERRTIAPYVKDLCGHMPGGHWFQRFLSRHHGKLNYSRPASLDPKRARAFNYPAIKKHFQDFEAVLREHDIPPENIYNMDEKGCQLGGGRKVGRRKYLFGRSSKDRYRIRDANLELVTVVECVSADGFALKPYIIFKGKKVMQSWFSGSGIDRAQWWVLYSSKPDASLTRIHQKA